MKTILMTAALGVGLVGMTGAASNAAVIINEVYPGGGATTAAFTRDFVELYNTDINPVDLTGYVLQYSAAASTSTFTGTIVRFGAGSVIGAGDFLTVATGTPGTASTSGATLTSANANFTNGTSGGASLSGTSGSVRLLDASASVVDLVGYGTLTVGTGNPAKSEGNPESSPSSTAVSLNRTAFADTNDNQTDFSQVAPSPTAGQTSTVVAIVPEPTTLAALGLGSLLLRRRRA